VEADTQRTDALTVEVKRLVARSRSSLTAAVAELCALGDKAIGILCSLAQAEGKLRSWRRWLLLILVGLGYALNHPILVAMLRGGTREPTRIVQ
jgi:hypothetical protein